MLYFRVPAGDAGLGAIRAATDGEAAPLSRAEWLRFRRDRLLLRTTDRLIVLRRD